MTKLLQLSSVKKTLNLLHSISYFYNSLTPKRLYELLRYIVEVPPEDADEKRMYKYPFATSEAFKTEVKEIMESFFITFDPNLVEPKIEEKKEAKVEKSPLAFSEASSEELIGSDNEEEVVTKTDTDSDKPVKEETSSPKEEANSAQEEIKNQEPEKVETSNEDSPEVTETKKEDNNEEDMNLMIKGKIEDEKENEDNNIALIPTKEEECDSVIINSEGENPECETGKFTLLERLLSFRKTEPEVNPVLSGYFENVIKALFSSKKQELLTYLFKNQEHIDNLLKHTYNQSISDIVVALLQMEEDPSKDGFVESKQNVIKQIVESITKNEAEIGRAHV